MNKNEEFNKVLKSMEKVYGEKYGLANIKYSSEKLERLTFSDAFDSYYIGNIIPMYYSYISKNDISQYKGSGCSLNYRKSLVKAYGEFIERYCASNFDNINDYCIVFDSYNNLSKKHSCLSLKKLIHFDEEIYGNKEFFYRKYTDDSCITWIKGNDIVKNKEIFLPAQKVFLGVNFKHEELPYIQWLSTGLACGDSRETAILGAVYEVIERDSFMLTWKLRLSGKKIVMDKIKNLDLSKLYNHIIKNLFGEDELHIYDISRTDGIYTVLTFINNSNPDSVGLVTAAASDIDIEKALLKSFEELCLTYRFSYILLLENFSNEYLRKEEVDDLDKHILYYTTGSRSNGLEFVDDENKVIKLSNMINFNYNSTKSDFEYLVSLFKKNNKSIYIADITSLEIKEIGLNVIKAIIADYNDLEIHHMCRLNNNPRLLKYKEIYKKEINDEPHPFP